MIRLGISHQTLQEFIDTPFGTLNKQKNLQYETKYQNYKQENKITVEGTLEIDDNYFVHLKVPSESQHGETYYDVVIQFFPNSKTKITDLSVDKYYVQFFSNSPGFVYKYAALYKLEGYLIESLYDKFAEGVLDTLPDKANSKYELYFDSSIYYASRYVLDNKLFVLGKLNLKVFKRKNERRFFEDIQDIESVSINRDVSNMMRSIRKEIASDQNKLSLRDETKLRQKSKVIGHQILKKKEAAKSTLKNGETGITIKKRSTSTTGSPSVKRITSKKKKSSSYSTRKTP